MNKQKFVEYLRAPAELDKEAISDLEALIETYPYFQSARTLLAKASKLQKSKKAGSYISSAAVYATDRILLKRYINDELIFLNPLDVHESHEADHERELTEVIKTNRITSAQVKQGKIDPSAKPTTDKAPEEGTTKKPTPTPTSKQKPQSPAPKQPKPKQPEPPKAQEPSEPSNLDQIISELYKDLEELKVSRARFREIEDQLAEDEAVDEAVKKATEKTDTPAKKDDSESKEASEIKKPAQSRSARVNKPEEPKSAKAKSSKATTRSAKGTTPRKKAPAPKKATGSTQKSSQKSTKKEEGDSKKEDKGDPKGVSQSDIINNFIKNNPTIPKPDKPSGKNQEDLSGDSTELHPDIASEYLAEIYLEQGRKERAIQIYESLIVRFPEKSTYFADIIKKLNESS